MDKRVLTILTVFMFAVLAFVSFLAIKVLQYKAVEIVEAEEPNTARLTYDGRGVSGVEYAILNDKETGVDYLVIVGTYGDVAVTPLLDGLHDAE